MKPYLWLTLVALFPVALEAQDVTFVHAGPFSLVELYTSEGCSSCPAAEAYLSGLKNSPDVWLKVFPVAFHVDYWNGLGWPDRFSQPGFTARQQTDAARLHQDSVYTPEFIVNGREWRGFFDHSKLPSPQSGVGELKVSVRADGTALSIHFVDPSRQGAQLTVNAALVGLGITSRVARGENSGRTLVHDFIVLNFASRPLTPAGQASFDLHAGPHDSPGALVAWVSAADGTILQAAGGLLTPKVAQAEGGMKATRP